jgi:hypothetical protein
MNEWNIQSRSHACQACEESFADKQPYHTLLFDRKNELLRIDVCESCWTSRYSQNSDEAGDLISRWQGVYEAPPPAPPEAIQKETAETLLRKLIEQGDPKHGAACFILAVMLERKRLLKVKEQIKRDGRRVFVYEQPKTGDIFTIADPDLRLDQLEEVQRDVGNLLEYGLSGPPPEQAAAAPENPAPNATDGSPSPDAPAAEAPASEAAPDASDKPATEHAVK